MSGNNEKPEEENKPEFCCFSCGSFKFVKYYNGFTGEVVKLDEQTAEEIEWETTDGNNWECYECGQPVPREHRAYLDELYWDLIL